MEEAGVDVYRYERAAGSAIYRLVRAPDAEPDRVPVLTPARQRSVRAMLRLLERHFDREYELDNLSQHEANRYVRARQSAWASERRHLPAQDVAAAAGWRSLQVMRSAYMQADAETVYSVVESKPVVHTSYTGETDAKPSQRITK